MGRYVPFVMSDGAATSTSHIGYEHEFLGSRHMNSLYKYLSGRKLRVTPERVGRYDYSLCSSFYFLISYSGRGSLFCPVLVLNVAYGGDVGRVDHPRYHSH